MSGTKTEAAVGFGLGFSGLLGIVFITLKLCGVISWPWVWVLSPLWGPLAFAAAVLLAVLGVALTVGLFALLVGAVVEVHNKRKARRG